MSKRYVAIDMRDSTVIKKYNRGEFSHYMSQILHDFAVKNGLDFFYYSNEHKAKYADKFIKYWNNNFYSFGKQTRLNVYRDPDDGYIKHTDGIFNKLDLYYIAFGKITKADKDYYQVSFVNPQWVLFNFNDVNFLHSSITGYHYQKHNFFTKRRRYSGGRSSCSFERYYAELSDTRYSKSLGEPPARGMRGTLGTRNKWSDWEDEVVSTKGNWKYSTKDKHQWEHRLKRKKPKNIEVIKEDPYTMGVLFYDYNNNQRGINEYDLPWVYRNFNLIIEPDAGKTLYAKEKNKMRNKDE